MMLGADHLTLEGGGVSDFEKKIPASACRKKKIACSTNVIESLWEKKGKKYPAHQIARKKILDDQKSAHQPPPPPPPPPTQELNGLPLKQNQKISKPTFNLLSFPHMTVCISLLSFAVIRNCRSNSNSNLS